MEAKGEKLLQDLVNQEKAVVAKVEQARSEAAAVLERAQSEAAEILAEAGRKADALAQAQAEKTRIEAETARLAIIQAAEQAVAAIEAKAKANGDRAVKMVLERVLP